MTDIQIFDARCIINIANYIYMSGESVDNIDLELYEKELDKSPNSPYYCFESNLNDLSFKNDIDPRWEALKIKDDLCDKYKTMTLCNLYWPCVINGMKRVCNDRGIYNCTSKSCQCFDGFINTPNDITCDIDINALFNDTLPQIPNDFIIDGSYDNKIIKPNKYKLPSPIELRYFSQAYLIKEFNKAINETNTLIIGLSIHYIDLDQYQISHLIQTKTIRSHYPAYLAINVNGIYQIGKIYWNSNQTTEISQKPGIGYTVNINIECYSSRSFTKFSTIGKKEIELKFANAMDISSIRIKWIKFIQINITNTINIMYDTAFTIKTSKLDVIEYFKTKYETNNELNPSNNIATNIKSVLKSRKIAVSNRKYGGMIIGEFSYPTKKIAANSFTDNQVNEAFKIGFQRVLKINIKYIDTEKYQSGQNDMLKIIIFEEENKFKSIYARLKDEKDPFTGYKPEHKFIKLLQNEMRFVSDELLIPFDSWNVTSNNYLYAAWYEISIFATMHEINSKIGITENNAKLYLNAFKQSLFDGMVGLDHNKEINAPNILRYFDLNENFGYKIQAQLKITADYVKKVKEIERNAIDSLSKITLNTGWGMIDSQISLANARMSIFASIFVDENINNANPIIYSKGFPKSDQLINILKDLLIVNNQKINIDILNVETSLKSNVLKITIEFYVTIDQKSFIDMVLDKVKDSSFVKLINEKALQQNVNIFVTECIMIYPSELNNNNNDHDNKVMIYNENTNSLMNITNDQTILTDALLPKFMDKYWPLKLPLDIFCSEFHTQLQFGTRISFGNLKQYFCIRLINIIPGKNNKIMLKTKLIYLPSKPNSPDSLNTLCDYWINSKQGQIEPNPFLDEKLKNAGPGIDNTCKLISVGKELIPDNLPNTIGNVQSILTQRVIDVMDLPDIILDGLLY